MSQNSDEAFGIGCIMAMIVGIFAFGCLLFFGFGIVRSFGATIAIMMAVFVPVSWFLH